MENVRTEQLLGNTKVIVGNKYSDLVLETLGKVYIKTGNNSRVLSDVLKLLDQTSEQEIKSLTIFVDNTSQMEEMEYPGDGYFIYNKLNTTLYISYDERYIALIEAAEGAKEGYVRRSGDTMTGPLEIITATAPLIVASSKLIKNLNAEYVGGYSQSDLAKKRVNEYIYGNWTFKGQGISENNWIFKNNVRLYGDLVTSGSISTPEFASGFGGYGWRIDADTNTLTIDYLVVRKAMKVYEMVINKISATNGSLWISNSSKCSSAIAPIILTETQLNSTVVNGVVDKNKLLKILKSDTYYLLTTNNTENIVTLSSELSKPSIINDIQKTFIDFKFVIHIVNPIELINSPLFTGINTLYDEQLLTSEWETYTGSATQEQYLAFKKCMALYYISKEKVVTKWGGNEGQWDEGTIPQEWHYQDTFDKNYTFYMIPKTSQATSDFEQNGSSSSSLVGIKTYYKYFAINEELVNEAITNSDIQFSNGNVPSVSLGNLWIINTDENEYPMFKPGDIIRCQKYSDGNIKYYDGLIMSQIGTRSYIMLKATSVFDIYTEISYNEDGSVNYTKEEYNTSLYDKTEMSFNINTGTQQPNGEQAYNNQNADPNTNTTTSRLDGPTEGDDMIQMGNIQDVQRQNAIYLTSCDEGSPFIDIISGLNRPDYSVLYDLPIYKRVSYIYKKQNSTFKYNGIKYDYYIQKSIPTIQYIEGISIDGVSYYGTLYPTRDSIIQQQDDQKYKHAYSKTTRVRLGNLDGIYNEIFKTKQPYGFGLYGENVFLTGEFYLSNGQSVVEFTEDSIKLAVGNIQVGGVNLVRNSKKNETSTAYGFATANVDLKEDIEYTFSVNGRSSQQALNEGHYLSVFLYKPDWSWSFSVEIKETEDITKFRTFKVPTTGGYSIGAYLFPSGGTRTGTVTVNWYKVERGNVATDWSPSPLDTEEALSNQQTQINQNKEKIELTASAVAAQENKISELNTKITQTAQSVTVLAKRVDTTETNISTLQGEIKVQADKITVLNSKFNEDGSLKNTAGLVTTSGFAGLFVQEFNKQDVVTSAEISVFITEEEVNQKISNIRLTADKITLEGYISANDSFTIDTQGNITATGGNIGGFTIASNRLYSNSIYDVATSTTGSFSLYSSGDSRIEFATSKKRAALGLSVFASSSGFEALAYLSNTSTTEFQHNGIFIDVSTEGGNYGDYQNYSIYNVRGCFHGFGLSGTQVINTTKTWNKMDGVVALWGGGNSKLNIPQLSKGYHGRVIFVKNIGEGSSFITTPLSQQIYYDAGAITNNLEIKSNGDAMILIFDAFTTIGNSGGGIWYQFKCPRQW